MIKKSGSGGYTVENVAPSRVVLNTRFTQTKDGKKVSILGHYDVTTAKKYDTGYEGQASDAELRRLYMLEQGLSESLLIKPKEKAWMMNAIAFFKSWSVCTSAEPKSKVHPWTQSSVKKYGYEKDHRCKSPNQIREYGVDRSTYDHYDINYWPPYANRILASGKICLSPEDAPGLCSMELEYRVVIDPISKFFQTDEPRYYEEMAKQYMGHETVSSVNWSEAALMFETYQSEKSSFFMASNLGLIEDKGVRTIVAVRLCQSDSEDVRLAVARNLRSIPDPELRESVREYLSNDRSERVRAAAR